MPSEPTKPANTGPVGELQTQGEFGSEGNVGNVIKQAKKIMKKMPKTKTNLGILAYMETMKDDADKLIETTHAEYIPVAKNCSAHTVAFERVGNKTEEVLASIKSQDAYQNETDALKAEMRIYSDQLSHMKESFQNATEEQNTVGVQHENKTP